MTFKFYVRYQGSLTVTFEQGFTMAEAFNKVIDRFEDCTFVSYYQV